MVCLKFLCIFMHSWFSMLHCLKICKTIVFFAKGVIYKRKKSKAFWGSSVFLEICFFTDFRLKRLKLILTYKNENSFINPLFEALYKKKLKRGIFRVKYFEIWYLKIKDRVTLNYSSLTKNHGEPNIEVAEWATTRLQFPYLSACRFINFNHFVEHPLIYFFLATCLCHKLRVMHNYTAAKMCKSVLQHRKSSVWRDLQYNTIHCDDS